MDTGGLAGFDGEVLRLHAGFGDHWLDGFGDFVDSDVQAVRDHGDGFRQADVLDGASVNFGAKFLDAEAGADFFLERLAAGGGVDDAYGFGVFDILRDGGEGYDELVHGEAGVDSGADQGDAPIFGGFIELRGEFRIGAIGVGQFLAGGDDAGFGFEAGEELVHHRGEGGGGGVDDDVGGEAENFGRVGRKW